MKKEILKEQPIPPAEFARAEARLTPEWRMMSQVRTGILAPLDSVDLPDNQVKIVCDYSDKAGEVARSEFERLQKESPVKRLMDALTDELSIAAGNRQQLKFIKYCIATVRSQVGKWEGGVAEGQSLAAINGETKTLEEIVSERIELANQQREDGTLWREKGGIVPRIGVLVTDLLKPGKSLRETMATAQATERILKKLGFLPEEGSVRALFALPEPPLGKTCSDSEIEQLRWSGHPARIRWDGVTGLQSNSMPGVAAQVENFGGDRAIVWFWFKPEAVVKSVAKVSAAATA